MSKKTLPPLHLACSDDELRPAMMHIEIKNGIATATNASLIAQLNLAEYSTLEDDTIKKLNGKMIHRDVWEEILDADVLTVEDDIIHYEKGGIKADYDIQCDYKFPDHKSIIDTIAGSIFAKKSFMAFNPKWIQIANKIFPSESLIVRFYESHEMLLIFPSGEAKGFVGVMPIQITEEEAVVDFTLS
jgi:hypothetical protein